MMRLIQRGMGFNVTMMPGVDRCCSRLPDPTDGLRRGAGCQDQFVSLYDAAAGLDFYELTIPL